MLTATAAEMVDTDQPNSSRSGSISTPGTARKAAAPTSARNVTAATHQAGWMRREVAGRAGSTTVTTGEHDRSRPTRTRPPADSDRSDPATPGPPPDFRARKSGEALVVTIDSPPRGTDRCRLWLSRG